MNNYYMGIKSVLKNPEHLNDYENKGYIIEPKIDGIALQLFTDTTSKVVKAIGRSGLEKEVPFIGLKLIPDTVIAGEYKDDKLYVFDIYKYKGKEVYKEPLLKRRELLEDINIYHDGLELVPQYKDNFYKNFLRLVKEGYEGVVLKKLSSIHTPNERTAEWHKVKKSITMDYIITGFLYSTSDKYRGLISSLKLGIYKNGKIVDVGKVSLPSEELKHKFSENPEKYRGKVVEVEGQEVFPTGAMRFPHFLKIREDLKSKEANVEKVVFEDIYLQEQIELKKAKEVVKELEEFLKPVVEKIEVAGSISRRHAIVNDVDLVAVPKGSIKEFLDEKDIKYIGREKSFFFDYKGVPINLWTTNNEESFPFLILHFSAGKGIIALKKLAIQKGLVLNRYGLWNEGRRVPIKNLDELFAFLGTTTKFYKLKMLEDAVKDVSEEDRKRFIEEGQFPRETGDYWRFRWVDPNEFDKKTFRSVKEKNGNMYVVGKLLSSGKWVRQNKMINKKNVNKKEIEEFMENI